MKTYPVMLNLRGRRCAVVGGGPVGLRRAAALAGAGAKVRLIAPEATDPVAGAELVRAAYRPEYLRGAAVVFACTDDGDTNARVAADARRAGAWVNVADQPDLCDFFVPACAADGDVVLAVGTGGCAPALAGALARALAKNLPPRAGEFAAALSEVRAALKQHVPDRAVRRRILSELAGATGYQAFLQGGQEALVRLARSLAGTP